MDASQLARGAALIVMLWPVSTMAAGQGGFAGPRIGPVPVEFIVFAGMMLGVAVFHRHALRITVVGTIVIALYKMIVSPFKAGAGADGFAAHLGQEWVLLVNLLLLMLGAALLADQVDKSKGPAALPRFLPADWRGAFVLLVPVFLLSSLLGPITAALLGGAVARTVFRGRLHIGYLAAMVAAANAGGAGSVLGDSSNTMMWRAGIPPHEVLQAFIASTIAVVVCGVPAAIQQQGYSPIQTQPGAVGPIDRARLAIVAFILLVAITVNIVVHLHFSTVADLFPFLGVAVWVALLATVALRAPDWSVLPRAARGAVLLLSLVLCASMMPLHPLPAASWQAVLGLGFVSAVFDGHALTAVALGKGGHDWGFLAYALAFGGSMIWFGSAAGVALTNGDPRARSVASWLRHGWHVLVAYLIGFFVMLASIGFHPGTTPRGGKAPAAAITAFAP